MGLLTAFIAACYTVLTIVILITLVQFMIKLLKKVFGEYSYTPIVITMIFWLTLLIWIGEISR